MAFWYRLLLVLVSVAGFMTGNRHAAYFTSIANTIVLAYYAIALWSMWRRRSADGPAPVLRGGVVTWIATVALIAHIQLNHGRFPDLTVTDQVALLNNWTLLIIHYVVPAMVLVDWIAFGPHGRTRWWHPLIWSALPVAYIVLSVARGALFPYIEDAYPYPFLEPGGRDPLQIVVGTVPMLPAVIALGFAVYALDKAVSAITRSGRRR